MAEVIDQAQAALESLGVLDLASRGEVQEKRIERVRALTKTIAQASRIEKYTRRGDYIEAFGYYHKWLLEPLIEVLRLRSSPLHPENYFVHISRHLPVNELARLEELFKIASLKDKTEKTPRGMAYFHEVAEQI